MMNYFEIRERLANLLEFRRLYKEYLDFTNRERNPAARMVRDRMEPLCELAVDSLNRVDLGSMITRDAPSRGGRTMRINLIRAIFREHLIRRFLLDDTAPLKILDRGIVRYRRRLWSQTVQLFNPLFWLWQFTDFLAKLPLLIAQRAGYDSRAAEDKTSVRLWTIAVQVLVFAMIFKALGVIDWAAYQIGLAL